MPSNRELIQSLYEAFGRGDAATVLGTLDPGVLWNEAEGNPYADENPYSGPERVGTGVFGRLLADFPDFAVHAAALVSDGGTVVATGRYSGTHQASGRTIDAQFAHVWTVRGGKVIRFQQYTDTAQFARVLGRG